MTKVPSAMRRTATTGTATSVSRLTSSVAPAKAPTKPGAARTPTVRQSVLPSLWWEMPETSVVPSSEKWIAAEAATGAIPAATSSVADVTPYPMPSEPSTSCATRPTMASRTSRRMWITSGIAN